MERKSFILPIFLGVLSVFLQADFVEVSVWHKLTSSGQVQRLILCGDQHDIKEKGFIQAQEVVQLVSNDKNSHIIVEDFNDLNGVVEDIKVFFEESKQQDVVQLQQQVQDRYSKHEAHRVDRAKNEDNSLLFLIPYFANKHSVECTNVDFRNSFSSDMQPYDIKDCASIKPVMSWMLQRKVERMRLFNDNEKLNEFYQKKVQQFLPFMNYICSIMEREKLTYQELSLYLYNLFLNNPDAYNADLFLPATKEDSFAIRDNLTDIINEIKSIGASAKLKDELKEMIDYLLDLCTVDLIDVQIMHEIFKKQLVIDAQNTVVVCCGLAHMQAIENMLMPLGYTKIENKKDRSGIQLKQLCEPYVLSHSQEHDMVKSLWLRISLFFSYCFNLFNQK
ncbi:MAG: hypothetical protein WD055_00460 [Candidatus Dependentiae bacterium]